METETTPRRRDFGKTLTSLLSILFLLLAIWGVWAAMRPAAGGLDVLNHFGCNCGHVGKATTVRLTVSSPGMVRIGDKREMPLADIDGYLRHFHQAHPETGFSLEDQTLLAWEM